MSEETTLIDQAIFVGLALEVGGDRLRVRGSKKALKSPLVEELRKHKAELLKMLAEDRSQIWDFRIVHIGRDPWMMGTRLDKLGCYVGWFIRAVQEGQPK